MEPSLAGKVALVTGATRGAGRGIAVQLGAAGATVYCTGRTTRSEPSEMKRPETIEETAALVEAAGGRAVAVPVDHLVPEAVRRLVERIDAEQGALHVLVNNIWGATTMEWDKTVWESSLDLGLHTLRLAVETHAITSHFALPLLIRQPGGLVVEVTDGTADYNADHYRVSFFYDLAKAANLRTAFALAHEVAPYGATAVAVTPGWLRSEAMLEAYGVPEERCATPRRSNRTSPSRRARRTSVGRSPHWPPIPTSPAGTASRCPAGSWPRSTDSPISTAAGRMPGATSGRSRTPGCPPTRPGIADRWRPRSPPRSSPDCGRSASPCPMPGRRTPGSAHGGACGARRSPTCSRSTTGGRRRTPGPPDPTGRCWPSRSGRQDPSWRRSGPAATPSSSRCGSRTSSAWSSTTTPDWEEVAELLTESYCVLAPAALVAMVDRPAAST